MQARQVASVKPIAINIGDSTQKALVPQTVESKRRQWCQQVLSSHLQTLVVVEFTVVDVITVVLVVEHTRQ